ncbi:uncharacterized protein LOC129588782 [Paramacrobiotus metropolitanus]|uniref:uncharacterized protein LOC129588782 n=1 Tax=Paramacrobiotus metropolitanus TaxID=2943436 RepID=UPI00244603DA|nr:uncharacterized protein LOC129588782 [Paramacrobiotus metropolitanus]XP_055339135.1 uncharacterized protein LOC129588782 [Paramacrobiotus metropolitanus]XP_055339136.1 uncharacterized protein LOC129588782 [Paramacrobiotus metropolitanus]XP_055339137.1 uncharacterized protein LOC129588782 [Paramacrobiotus metropolitanus]
MCLYEKELRCVCTWNSVDVEVDGQLQHGHVIGLENVKGTVPQLIVDYGCPEQRAVPVTYGRIFHCAGIQGIGQRSVDFLFKQQGDTCPEMSARANRIDVEVLFRTAPIHPRKWYPAKLLMSGFLYLRDFALVEVKLAGNRYRELLHLSQVRYPSSEEEMQRRILAPGMFVIRSKCFSEGYWIPLDPAVAVQFIRDTDHDHISPVLHCGCKIHTFLPTHAHELKTIPVENLEVAFEKYRVLTAFEKYCVLKGDTALTRNGIKDEMESASADNPALKFLPPELLQEIFHSMDTIDRLRCGRTCQLWDTILNLPELCRDLRVRLSESRNTIPTRIEESNYGAYACIFKHITPATRTIAIRGTAVIVADNIRFEEETNAGQALGYIGRVVKAMGTRLDRLVLRQRNISVRLEVAHVTFQGLRIPRGTLQGNFDHLSATYSSMASWCEWIIWTNCTLNLNCPAQCVIRCHIPRAVFHLRSINTEHVWDIFEQNLVDASPVDMERVSKWAADQITKKSPVGCHRIIKILMAYQTGDPRLSSHYSQWNWTLHNLDSLDIWKVNKICFSALSSCVTEANDALSADSRNCEPLRKMMKTAQ